MSRGCAPSTTMKAISTLRKTRLVTRCPSGISRISPPYSNMVTSAGRIVIELRLGELFCVGIAAFELLRRIYYCSSCKSNLESRHVIDGCTRFLPIYQPFKYERSIYIGFLFALYSWPRLFRTDLIFLSVDHSLKNCDQIITFIGDSNGVGSELVIP